MTHQQSPSLPTTAVLQIKFTFRRTVLSREQGDGNYQRRGGTKELSYALHTAQCILFFLLACLPLLQRDEYIIVRVAVPGQMATN